MTVLCENLSTSLIGRNVVSEMGNASSAPSRVVHECKPLPRGKTPSLNDDFEVLPVFSLGVGESTDDGSTPDKL
jgi:hypothetical protein